MKLDFRQRTKIECATPGCHRTLKANVVNRQPNARICFQCHVIVQKQRGHLMRDYLKFKQRMPQMV